MFCVFPTILIIENMSGNRKRVVVFTGAGVSADSGIATFRDEGGLWAKYRIEDVCTPQALELNRDMVLDFYNMRRREVLSKEPNAGHYALVELEKYFEVDIVTQNVDDLHERAGSSRVLHLHGEITKLCSTRNHNLIYEIDGWEQDPVARAADGELLRPFIVFFGEPVPKFEEAVDTASKADIMIVAGTSLAVYPAASLVGYVPAASPVYLVDPGNPAIQGINNIRGHIKKNSAEGLPELVKMLKSVVQEKK